MKKSILFTFLIFVSLTNTFAQQAKVEGFFLEDSMKIGERVHYILKASYPTQSKLLFPDSLYNYGNFEYVSRSYSATKLVDGLLQDSAVYELTTFELDSLQTLSLAVFVITEKDSIPIFAVPDSVFLKTTVSELPNEIELKESSDWRAIDYLFNYPYLTIGILLFIIVLVIIWVVFGRKLTAQYKTWALKRRHLRYIEKHEALAENLSATEIAELHQLWKNYLEKLLKLPVSKWTSKEILQRLDDNENLMALHEVDRYLYSSNKDTAKMRQAFEQLKEAAILQFELKLKELKNAR